MRGLFTCLTTLFIICTCTPFGRAQDKCNIRIAISPDIRGIKLGMKFEEVRAQFTDSIAFKLAPKADEAGVIEDINLSILDWYQKLENFKGVEIISLVFVDGKLVKIGVAYDKSAEWPNIESFAAQVSKSLAMPLTWRAPTNADPTQARVMDCEGFRMIAQVASPGAKAFLGLVDTAGEKTIKERRAAIEERKRQTFKP